MGFGFVYAGYRIKYTDIVRLLLDPVDKIKFKFSNKAKIMELFLPCPAGGTLSPCAYTIVPPKVQSTSSFR